MKIAITPDLHLNKAVYKGVHDRDNPSVPFRSADFMRAFEKAVDRCINELHPDLFVIPGDVYDNPSPSNRVRGFFSAQLKKLNAHKIPVIVLLGNHDVFMTNHALKDIKELGLKNIKIIERPTILSYQDVKLLLLPYSTDVEQKKLTMKDEFDNFLKEIKEKDDGTPSLFFGHFSVHGAKMNEYDDPLFVTNTTTTEMPDKKKGRKDFINRNPNDIKVEDLDEIGAEYVFLGDFHEFQVLKTKKCIAMYGGSIEKSDFSDINQKKGFIFYDSEAESKGIMGKCRFIENNSCRPMLELKGNLDNIKEQFEKIDKEKFKDSIVKISFQGTESEKLIFSSSLDSFKKELCEKLNPIYFDSTQKVNKTEAEEEATKLEEEIMEKGHLESDDIIPIVTELLMSKIEDEKEAKATIELSEEIYNEVVKG
jgi:DNA repair exonuclease SbcCD nuclease subunit